MALLEVWGLHEREVVTLEGDRLRNGKNPANDPAITADDAAARTHAVLERSTGSPTPNLGARGHLMRSHAGERRSRDPNRAL